MYIVEEYLFFKQYKFHKQKLFFHRASMKYYEWFLKEKNIKTTYISSNQVLSDIRTLISHLSNEGVKEIHLIEPDDDWLKQRVRKSCKKQYIP